MKYYHLFFPQRRTRLAATLSKTCLPFFTSLLPGFFQENLAQAPAQPKSYECYQPDKRLVIDGKLNESSWKKAAWTSLFEDIEGNKKPKPLQQTRAKMLWDKDYLYIAAVIEEEHIWAYQNRKDQIVYFENDFEVFIDPDGDTENYYELEVNALNNIFDLFLAKTYRNGGKADIKWDIEGLQTAVSIEGTINNATDRDKQWTVEIAIPFKGLSTSDVAAVIPENGSEWRVNFSRVNWQHEVDSDGKYARKRDAETKKIIPEYNWVWSPQGIINMHYPEYWGKLHFNARPVSKAKRRKTGRK